jgi:hypothetical protein
LKERKRRKKEEIGRTNLNPNLNLNLLHAGHLPRLRRQLSPVMPGSQPSLRVSPEEPLANQLKETVISACVLYEDKAVMKMARDQKTAMMTMTMTMTMIMMCPTQRPTMNTMTTKKTILTTLYIAKISAERITTKTASACGLLLSVHFEPHAGILSARPAPTVEQRGHPDFIILRESWCFVYLLCDPVPKLSL